MRSSAVPTSRDDLEALPLTHFIRIVRGVMLKGTSFADNQGEFVAIAMSRYRRTLD